MSRLLLTGLSLAAPVACTLGFSQHAKAEKYLNHSPKTIYTSSTLPTRSSIIEKLKKSEPFDVLVIGGGATGAGVALDSASRGLQVALIERDDFASGTSSKSTKLIHGGVRYLEKAFMRLDISEFKLVMEALRDRKYMLESAPHLSSELPLMLPVYSLWKAVYFWAGIKVYDLVAWGHSISSSYFLTKSSSVKMFPDIKQDGLVGSIVYYDGQQNDSRMNVAIALSAIKLGAAATNYCSVEKLIKKMENGKEVIEGVIVKDVLSGEEFEVKAKTIVNATGCFTDSIRKQVKSSTSDICKGSSGVHLVIPKNFCPEKVGLLDPATSDGRVLFVLPWEGRVVVGTSDQPCEIQPNPKPTEAEIKYILGEINKLYCPKVNVQVEDILSAWSGIRPLVVDPKVAKPGKTSSISRNHVIEVVGNSVTISGGKWTTYRSMAEDTVDELLKLPALSQSPAAKVGCYTSMKHLPKLHGAENWSVDYYKTLMSKYGLSEDVAKHLSHNYGTEATGVLEVNKSEQSQSSTPICKKLSEKFPFIEQEVTYACRKEYACKAVDVISRRMRLAFLDSEEALQVLPRVADIMAGELNWSSSRKKTEIAEAVHFLEQDMGILVKKKLISP